LSEPTSKTSGTGLNFVTAIVDGDLEASVAQLLYSHSNNIIFRALDANSLCNFLSENDLNFQVIYSGDFENANFISEQSAKYPKIRFIEVFRGFDPANLLLELSQIHPLPVPRNSQRFSNLISIMGSSGAPGVSVVTNQIAARFPEAKVLFAPRNQIRPEIWSENKANVVSSKELDNFTKNLGQTFLDAGSVTTLTSTFSDRRSSGQILNWAINCSAKIFYVIKPDENGIASLRHLLADYQNLISPPPLICILNQQRFNNVARSINSQFNSIIANNPNFQIPYDHSSVAKYPGTKQWWSTTFTKQFDLIAKSLASI